MEQGTSASAFNFDCTGNLKKCFVCRKSLNTKHVDDCENKSEFSFKSDNRNLCKLFLTLAFRYIKFESGDVHLHETLNLNSKSALSQNQTISENADLCCKICEPLLSTFCELYDQLTLVKLHINDNLERIVNLIESYNGDAKDHNDDSQSQDFGSGSWRKPFVAKVYSKCKEFPQLKLTNIQAKTKADHLVDHLVDENDHDHLLDDVDPLQINSDPLPEKVNSHHHDGDVQQLQTANVELVPIFDKPFKCQYCPKSFYQLRNLCSHKTKRHLELLCEEKSGFKCSHCSKGFIQRKNLVKHVAEQHGLTLGTSTEEMGSYEKVDGEGHHRNQEMPISDNETSNEAVDKPFKCQHCPTSFKHRSNLVRHQALCHDHDEAFCKDGRLFKCSHCEKNFLRRDILLNHQAEQHGLTVAVENSNLNENQDTITLHADTFQIPNEAESSGKDVALTVDLTNDDHEHEIPISVNQTSITRPTSQTHLPQRSYIKIAPKVASTETEGNERVSARANQNQRDLPLRRPSTETQSPYSSYIHIPVPPGKVKMWRRKSPKIVGEKYSPKLLVTYSGHINNDEMSVHIKEKPYESPKRQQTFTVVLPNTSRSVSPGINNLNESIMEIDEGQVFQPKKEKVHIENGNVEVEDKSENHVDVENFILPD